MISIKDEIAKILEDNIDGLNGDEILEIIEIPADPKMRDYTFPCFRLDVRIHLEPGQRGPAQSGGGGKREEQQKAGSGSKR